MDRKDYNRVVLVGESIPLPDPPAETGPKSSGIWLGIASTLGALALAAAALWPRSLLGLRSLLARLRPPIEVLRRLHSGHVADYVAWLTLGFAASAAAFAAVLV